RVRVLGENLRKRGQRIRELLGELRDALVAFLVVLGEGERRRQREPRRQQRDREAARRTPMSRSGLAVAPRHSSSAPGATSRPAVGAAFAPKTGRFRMLNPAARARMTAGSRP